MCAELASLGELAVLRTASAALSLTAAVFLVSIACALCGTAHQDTSQDVSVAVRAAGFSPGSPLLLRIFKRESLLELWMRKADKFELFKTYPICHWSGRLGPKEREGDRQAPEGFYSIAIEQLHVTGRRPRALNLGFPNSFDRASGRTGSYILIHGGCTSIGCFAMTNSKMNEIYAVSEAALRAGQEKIPVEIFPFRMTEESCGRGRQQMVRLLAQSQTGIRCLRDHSHSTVYRRVPAELCRLA